MRSLIHATDLFCGLSLSKQNTWILGDIVSLSVMVMVDVVKCSLDWTWTRGPSPAASPGCFFSKNLILMSSIPLPARRDLEMDWFEGRRPRRGERVRVSRVTETTTLDDLHPFNGMCVDQGTSFSFKLSYALSLFY